jgi:PAS domain S-box-containing protein
MEKNPAIAEILMQSLAQSCDVFFITDAEGVIIYANPAFEALTGYSRAEVIGKNPRVLKSGENPPQVYAAMWADLKAGRPWTGRLRNRRKDGSVYLDEQRICPVKDPSGMVKYYFSTRRDVTRELELESQLGQSQKMESLGLLAGQISHDFNNLLTVIIGSMELILEDLKPGSIGHKLSTEILRSSKESTAMIKNLMVFARRHDSHPVGTVLNEPVNEMKVLLDSLLGKGISVIYELDEALAPVKLEPENFKQAIMNLAINAKDAMDGKGAISIKTYNAGPEGLPAALTGGVYAVFEIADTGPGIPRDVLPRMFEPFFTTKPKGKGTGLGLSTVYGMVHQNGGHIFAANRHQGGAVFTIYFPVTE